ncbi:DUF2834 domain-containing protein [Pelagovum pacificum]|uniref:DUF2834 domain-containing protein n=1 Tax=Pelagovum pacificum TaxID=2588711 RepID=A0A5C5GD76_9RHOB|nr:DUF2834 domain-containing protein [Pelagovum pacificum]QQA42406.1 DUF2834 domain-containing protein [Pelagovum pacificum]TNY31489.1 DUF2834 domain-containing protein [Pelagovum pacificum]
MSPLRIIYLALAIWGTVHPMYFFVTYLRSEGASFVGMLDLWVANPAVEGMAWDLMIAGTTLVVWILAETFVRRNWSALLAIPATFCIGVSCGFPLYLFLRTRPV